MLNRLKQLYRLLNRRDRIGFAILLAMIMVGSLLEVIGIGVVPLFMGIVANPEKAGQHPKIAWAVAVLHLDLSRPERLVRVGSYALIVIFLLKNSYLVFNRYCQMRFIKNRQISLSKRLFRAYMMAPYEFHLRRNSAELLRNVATEVTFVCENVLLTLLNVCMGIIMSGSILILLAFVNPLVTLVTCGILALAGGGLQMILHRRMLVQGRIALRERKNVAKTINQGLGSLKEIRLQSTEAYFVNDLERSSRLLAISGTYESLFRVSVGYYLEFVAVSTMLITTMTLVALGRSLSEIAATLVLFGMALIRLKTTMTQIVSGLNMLNFKIQSVEPVYNDLVQLERLEIRRYWKSSGPLRFLGAIELKGVSYRYPQTEEFVLGDINLRIDRGSSIAFVGTTGAGKTTLVDIILGLLPPTNGGVFVDGANIQGNLRGWQANIGYVPQVIYLTDDSIRRNIALGYMDDEIDELKVLAAVQAAQLGQFIESLPKGMDTCVGERGVCISGGQRQRIGIARALYHNPEVIVLDEATSALDDSTEAAVIEAIASLRNSHTVIMIAHRLSTTEGCDFRYLLEDGKLRLTESKERAAVAAQR